MSFKYKQKELGFEVLISEADLNEIYTYSKRYYPNEYGGILIGRYSECSKKATVTEVCVPTKFQCNRFLFKRYVKNLNKRLKTLYREYNGVIIYVGEWHSHPNGSAQYSSKDLKSISEISLDSNVKISSPLMLIVSIINDTCSEKLYICHKQKIFTYEKIT